MHQFVPQLILGNALDGSSGPPLYIPKWGEHQSWQFGAHYFFEIYNSSSQQVEGHAAYGNLFNTTAGEQLYTTFIGDPDGPHGLQWTMEMGVVGDPSRVSTVTVSQPYMGLGKDWATPSLSWNEVNYTNMCINSCWELYGTHECLGEGSLMSIGATDRQHLPGTGSRYDIKIQQGGTFDWVTKWDEDEGYDKLCPSSNISEYHNDTIQHVIWDIFFPKV